MAAHVLILGCGRSGTSIFGELFESIPGFTYASEPLIDELPLLAPEQRLAVKVPRQREGDSSPAGMSVAPEELFSALPEPLVVFWEVRHPFDAVCSLRIGIGQGWAHHPRPPDWREWLDRPLLEQCAHHWSVINSAGFEAIGERAVVNRFEDMIRDPFACAERSMQIVGIDPADVSDELHTWAERVQDTNNDKFVEAIASRRHSRPDHDRRIDRWHDDLTADDVSALAPLVSAAASRFGYEI
ncbi:MAG: hypothetical protein WBA45_02640 [Microthrixaceae bacterium]